MDTYLESGCMNPFQTTEEGLLNIIKGVRLNFLINSMKMHVCLERLKGLVIPCITKMQKFA